MKLHVNGCRGHNRPLSAISGWVGFVGLIGLLMSFGVAYVFRPNEQLTWVLLMAGTAAPMLLFEYWRNRHWQSHAVAPIVCTKRQIVRWKIRGVLFIILEWLLVLGLFYVCGVDVIATLVDFSFWLVPLLIIYLAIYLSRYTNENWEDGSLLQLGFRLDQQGYHWRIWKDIARNNLIKAFFLPLMIDFSYSWVVVFYRDLTWSPDMAWYFLPMTLLYLVDTVYGCIGYLCNSRRFQTHIRSSNPYLLAWVAALLCYPPLVYLREMAHLKTYESNASWYQWFDFASPLFYIWGGAIIALTMLYAWATVIYGLRFSNLTNRGIITNGPYRFFKHPAYWAKNASWWLLYVPFLSVSSGWLTLQMVGGLLVTNIIYWCRAKTEEWHLMQDSQYQAYSQWIKLNGVFSRIKSGVRNNKGAIRYVRTTFLLAMLLGLASFFYWRSDSLPATWELRRFAWQHSIDGMVAAIRYPDGNIKYVTTGYRFAADGRKIARSKDELLLLGSLSKPITAMAIRWLISHGHLKLSDRLVDLLPQFDYSYDEHFKDITVQNLLQHTMGINRRAAGELIYENDQYLSCEQGIESALHRKLDYAPGSAISYANVGYCFLGEIIEAVEHKPYESVVRAMLQERGVSDSKLYLAIAPTSVDWEVLSPRVSMNELSGLKPVSGWITNVATLLSIYELDRHDMLVTTPPAIQHGDSYYGLGWRVWHQPDGAELWMHFGVLSNYHYAFIVLMPNGASVIVFADGELGNYEEKMLPLIQSLYSKVGR